MRKKLITASAVIIGLAFIAGCIEIYFNYGQRIDLRADDSGSIKVVYYISPNYEFSVTRGSIYAQYDGAPFSVRDAVVETVGNRTMVSYEIDFKDVTDLNGWGDFGREGSEFKHSFYFEKKGGRKTFREVVRLRVDPAFLVFLNGVFIYKINVPGEIVETNGIKGEGNAVTWEHNVYDLSNRNTEMYVTYKAGLPTWAWIVIGIALLILLIVAAITVVIVTVVVLKRRKRKPVAEPPPEKLLPEPPEPPPAAPPVRHVPSEPRFKARGLVIAIIIAAALVVVLIVAAFLITHFLGVNPLTKPPGEEAPAPPPEEVKPEPAVPKAKITFAVLQVAGGGRDAASVRDALAGKAESISAICEGQGSGELDVELAISAKGNVVRAKVTRSTFKNATLESKVAYAARGWKFDAARGTSKTKIRIKVD